MSFNKITIVGYLGRDPELRYTAQGTAVCKMSVATTERRRGSSGETEEHTTWFRVTVWGRQAELANEYLGKGRQVYLEGRLRLEEYADREGNQRISPEVTATDIQFLGQRSESITQIDSMEKRVEPVDMEAEPARSVAKAQAKPAGSKGATKRQLVSIDEDEIPF
jgi:single-strand DNA-binding protein